MNLRTALLAAAATVAIAPAANAYEGLYGAVGAGLNYLQPDRDFSNDGPSGLGPITFDTDSDHSNGVGVYAALGYAWGNNFRSELEFAYRDNDIRHITSDGPAFSGWPDGTLKGDTAVKSIMLNTLYDLDGITGEGTLTPYVGGGFGFANINPKITGTNPAGAPVSPMTIAYGGSKSVFAYQGIAGVAVDLAENLVLDLSYRFFGTKKVAYSATLNGSPAAIDIGYHTHTFMAGLRWNFGSEAPPPVQYKDCWDGSSVPITSECPPQVVEDQTAVAEPVQFTVYFNYDKSNLTSQASALIQDAAARALENDIDTVVVAGNTDTSGSSAYNQALSERRAAVVRDALIANGVPADRIRVEAYGESNPAKATPDGTREPLNRRTDVTITFE